MNAGHQELIHRIEENIGRVVLGKPAPIRLAVVALLTEGHVLIEDAPGVGKTTLARAMAKSINCGFKRLQFTPDMLPSDILGSSVYLPNLGEFEFRKGPIFSHVLLADEINRTTPRTQSALLEAMSEYQVSIEGTTYPLQMPFFVVATQNPFEFEGTYALPENQLDRFMMRIDLGYPDREIEKHVLESRRDGDPVEQLKSVVDVEEIQSIQKAVRSVQVEESVADYILDIIEATRQHPDLRLGVSTRGGITLYRAAQGLALCEGRDFVIPSDVKRLAVSVLAHRIVYRGVVRDASREQAREIMEQILDQIPVPE